ncbi:hypothetical protein BBJ28_00014685 [Nothophytophthora sp. Chile5]|nr:hypothetical protein BBJ28_00014685 [Nothophytophthora sp. Chile5]
MPLPRDDHAASSPSLQVADLFNAQAAEVPYQRLVAVLNTQARQIQKLQEMLRDLQDTQRQTLQDSDALHAIVSPLCARLLHLEGELATQRTEQAAAQQQRSRMQHELCSKVEQQELRDWRAESERNTVQLGQELRAETASVQVVHSLLQDRLETADRRLSAKMDKSEASRLDGVLLQIHGFAPLATQLSTDIAAVQTRQQTLEFTTTRLDSHRARHQDALQELKQQTDELQQSLEHTEKRHRLVEAPRIQQVDDALEQLQKTLTELSTTSTTRETTLRTLSAKFHSSLGALADQFTRQQRHVQVFAFSLQGVFIASSDCLYLFDVLLQRLLDEKASRVEMQTQVTALGRQLTTKAADQEHKTLSASVVALQERCEELQHHVELSTRFLDWFARRGEAYEHNLELVETQLGRLAVAAHPQSREPFAGHVRFPRSP